jgi:glutamyl-tRNA reductase
MLASMITVTSEEQNNNDSDARMTICEEIKNLDTDFSEQAYTHYIKRLSQNNLSVCDCCKYLLNKKEQKSLSMMKLEGTVTQEKLQLIKDTIEQLREKDQQNTPTLIFDPSIPPKICDLIQKKIKESGIRRKTIEIEDILPFLINV